MTPHLVGLVLLLACGRENKGGEPIGVDDSVAPHDSGPRVDADGDGHASVESGGDDCDDADAEVHPDATERCDDLNTDEDCDGASDDADPQAVGQSTWYQDMDGDGYGDTATASDRCDAPAGAVSLDGDCDDEDANANPSCEEVCDELNRDEDCDGRSDDDDRSATGQTLRIYWDNDGDGYGGVHESGMLVCDGEPGYVDNATDCDDADPEVNPGADEVWYDGVDQNCRGYDDDDQDGDHIPLEAEGACAADPDDTDPEITVSETSCKDGADEDCDGLIDCEDEDCDADVACGELDCTDEADDDEDGFVDCDDTDCWGTGCPTTARTRLRGGDAYFRSVRHHGGFNASGYPSDVWIETSSIYVEVHARDVWGDVQLYRPDYGTTTCEFYVGNSRHSSLWAVTGMGVRSSSLDRRSSSGIEPGCGDLDELLPDRLRPHDSYASRARWYTDGGALWYEADGFPSTSAIQTEWGFSANYPLAPQVRVTNP